MSIVAFSLAFSTTKKSHLNHLKSLLVIYFERGGKGKGLEGLLKEKDLKGERFASNEGKEVE